MAGKVVKLFDKTKKKKGTAKLLAKMSVSFLLILAVYGKANLHGLAETLKTVHWQPVILLMTLYTFGQFLSATKWRLLLKGSGIDRKWIDILKAYFFGMFINSFAFGTIGGDVARALAIKPGKGERAKALASVIADRLHGLAVLLTIGGTAIVLAQPESLPKYAVPLAALGVVVLSLGWLAGPSILTLIARQTSRFGETIAQIASAFPRQPKVLLPATLISATFHTTQILMHVVIAYMLSAELPLPYLFAVVPIVNAASSLPISIQGIGIRESLYVFFFVSVGVPHEVAVAFGAIWIVSITIVSALGGLLLTPNLVVGKEYEEMKHEQEALEAEEEQRKVVGGKS